ncbi:hypothetical protein [Effusibacillus consociatus]|uniref:AraC family transcriptional regulator n=1 Tax=Effusibacillus consociatus TaxID=1117041 RepID=A0ABV9QCG3_9BACL
MNHAIQIETGKSIRFENVASFRKKMKQSEVNLELGKFVNFLQQNNVQKNGPMITATFGVENDQQEQILDIEFLIPIDKQIDMPHEYTFKPLFHLVHAVYARYIGDPLQIENTYNELTDFLQQNKLQQITPAYNMNLNDIHTLQGNEPIIDIYIGVNPSIL